MIPKIVHYVFGLKQQTEEFLLIYCLSILSVKAVINPEKIYFCKLMNHMENTGIL